MEQNKPKVLVYDLEISPRLGWAYDMWETNILKIERPSHIMSLSWHWLGEKRKGKYLIHHITQADSPARFKADSTDDYDIVKKLWDLQNEADIVIAHNANRFDNKVSNTMFIHHGMTPPSPYKTIDTLIVARSKFKFPRNSLSELGEFLDLGKKTEVTHSELWYDCIINNDRTAWKNMAIYNDRDVELLTDIYYKLRPYISNHPNMAVISQDVDSCPKCGSHQFTQQGTRSTTTMTYHRFKCSECGGWFSDRQFDKDSGFVKPTYVNA